MPTISYAERSAHMSRINIVEFPEIQQDPLKRLFYSRDDRYIMDETRRNGSTSQVESVDSKTPMIVIPPDLYIKGVVIKKDGKHTVWSSTDNSLYDPSLDSATLNPRAIRRNGSVRLRYDETKFRLRPGQVWSVREDQVKERHLYTPIEETEEIPLEIGENLDFSEEEELSNKPKDNRPKAVKEGSKLIEQATLIRAKNDSTAQQPVTDN